jgi:DMSO reductase anchor subunit
MRVLDYEEIREQRLENSDKKTGSGKIELWNVAGTEHPFPLPTYSRTEPHLAIKPHAGMLNGLEKVVSNLEEVEPPGHKVTKNSWLGALVGKGLDELPLVAFTLLGQMAAGMAVFSPLVHRSFLLIISIGLLLGIGGLFSFLHLGTKRNAWRAIFHLKKSWLSREILMAGLFGASWLISLAERWTLSTDYWLPVTALLGLGMVYSMANVYRLRSVPAWNTWRTNAAFFMTAGILGLMGVGLLAEWTGWRLPLLILLAGQVALILSAEKNTIGLANRIRVALILLGMTGLGTMFLLPGEINTYVSALIFFILLAEETFGRWRFYASRTSSM